MSLVLNYNFHLERGMEGGPYYLVLLKLHNAHTISIQVLSRWLFSLFFVHEI